MAPGSGLAGATAVSGASPTGATAGFASAMASSAFSIAAPMAVPRPIVSDSIAAASTFRSVVGGTLSSANPEKTTRAIRTPFGCSSTYSRAASCATANRLGRTSVAHIDPETSIARTTDVRA